MLTALLLAITLAVIPASPAAALGSAPVVTLSPVDTTLVAGDALILTAAATGSPTPQVRWQRSTDDGASWFNLSSTNTTLYVGNIGSAADGSLYRAVFTNSAGTAPTTAAHLTVTPRAPNVGVQPSPTTVDAGDTAYFYALAYGDPVPTRQWQRLVDSTWVDVVGETAYALAVVTNTSMAATTEYRAVFTNAAGEAVSDAVTLTVDGVVPPIPPAPPISPPAPIPPAPPVAPPPPEQAPPVPPVDALADTPVGFVHRLYLTLFGRVADPIGLAYWSSEIDAGMSTSTIVAAFMESAEWDAVVGEGSDAAYVDELYTTILGRVADPAGAIYWVTQLRLGRISRAGLLTVMIDSPELRAALRARL